MPASPRSAEIGAVRDTFRDTDRGVASGRFARSLSHKPPAERDEEQCRDHARLSHKGSWRQAPLTRLR